MSLDWEGITSESVDSEGKDIVAWENIFIGGRSKTVEEIVLAPVFRISCAKESDSDFTPYKTTAQLSNITGWDELPDFSGNIRYEGEFVVTEAVSLKMVEVFINGMPIGKKIIPLYTFEITDAVKRGANTLTVIVSNHSGYHKRDGLLFYLKQPNIFKA